jgi:peroxiredoxin
MTTVLLWAAVYNIAFGAFTVLLPNALFNFAGIPPLNYPGVWQCVGMIVGVYGLGYGISAFSPYRHWPIVLVGLLGKIFGPIGFIYALIIGEFNLKFGSVIITNDIIWWIPFTLILKGAYEHWHNTKPEFRPLEQSLHNYHVNSEMTLGDYSETKPMLLIFLRHSGCTFCKETLAKLATSINEEQELFVDLNPVVVTMSSDDANNKLKDQYGLKTVPFISDPSRELYQSVDLKRGTLGQLFGLPVWINGFKAALQGHGVGQLDGDGFQMGGTFIVHQQKIVKAHRLSHAAEAWVPQGELSEFCSIGV